MTPRFYGMLTVNNIQEVADRLEKLLSGRRYALFSTNDGFSNQSTGGFECRTDQKLKKNNRGEYISVTLDEKWEYAFFNVSDTYGVWGCLTNLKEDKFDPEFKNPYIMIDYNWARMIFRVPAGYLVVLQVTLQDKDKE